MSKGSKTGTTQTIQKSDPWGPQQPFLQDIFRQAQGLYQSGGPDYYPGNTFTPFSPQSQTALGLMEGRALAGSPVTDAAQRLGADTLSGNYLNANPYLDATYEKASRAMMPGINATFGLGGRTGSQAHAASLGTGLADLATGIYGQNYQQERDRQQNMAAMAPGLAQSDYADFDRLLGVGGAIEGKGMENIQDAMNRFNFYQNRPERNLQNYAALVSGNLGQSSSGQSTSPMYGANPLVNTLGLGLAGLGTASSLGLLGGLGSAGAGIAGAGGIASAAAPFMLCHLAREVYGYDNPKWIKFYQWKESNPSFKKLYDKHAMRIAMMVKDRPSVKEAIRNWMDQQIEVYA